MNTLWELWVINLGTLSTFVGTAATLWVLLQTSKLTTKFNRKASIYFHKEKLNTLFNSYYIHISEIPNANMSNKDKILLQRKMLSLHNYFLFMELKDKKFTAYIKKYIINTKKILAINNHEDLSYNHYLHFFNETITLLDYVNNTLSISERKI